MLRNGTVLLLLQITAHTGLIYLIFTGSYIEWSICFLTYFLTGCLGMSMTFHRLLSHRSWRAPLWFRRTGVILGSLGLTGTALAWASIHRQHHASTDQKKDPHSPIKQPWWRVQFLSMYYKPNLRFSKDLLQDPFIVWCHRNYLLMQVLYTISLAAISPRAVIFAYLAPAAILWQAGSLINTLGHSLGYRNFNTNDHSVNNPLLGFFMWGEGWHNNHHAKPFKSSFRVKPWEIDISSQLIKIIKH